MNLPVSYRSVRATGFQSQRDLHWSRLSSDTDAFDLFNFFFS